MLSTVMRGFHGAGGDSYKGRLDVLPLTLIVKKLFFLRSYIIKA
jgi:hypothetical protein